jgi:hypothetical protein
MKWTLSNRQSFLKCTRNGLGTEPAPQEGAKHGRPCSLDRGAGFSCKRRGSFPLVRRAGRIVNSTGHVVAFA